MNWSGTDTVHAVSHSLQPVHRLVSMNRGFCRIDAVKRPSPAGSILPISASVRTVTFGWCVAAAIFGVEMQLAQSSVGKTLLSRTILPPTLGSFSTINTR